MRFIRFGARACVCLLVGQQSCAVWTACTGAVLYCAFVILTKWFSLTRLETRTKESNIYASIWVVKTLMRNESKELF